MDFRRPATGILALILATLPAMAIADVYVNSGSSGLKVSSIHTRGCSTYGNGARCDDSATGQGAGITFQANDLNGNCAGANPNQWPCHSSTYCYVKIGRHQSGAFGQTTHYDLLQVSTQVGGPSSTPGAISVGPQYKQTRQKCAASWTNGNTLVVTADLLK